MKPKAGSLRSVKLINLQLGRGGWGVGGQDKISVSEMRERNHRHKKRDCYEQLYVNKFNNSDEIDKFLEDKLPKLT